MDPGANAVTRALSSDTKPKTSKKKHCQASSTNQIEDSGTKKIEKIAAHKMSICDRAKIQELVDFASARLAFHEMRLSPFKRNHFVSEHFSLISLDGAPLSNMALCKNCKTVLVRFRKGTTNLKVHQKRHVKSSQEIKTTKTKNLESQIGAETALPMKKKRKLSKKKILVCNLETSQAISAPSN